MRIKRVKKHIICRRRKSVPEIECLTEKRCGGAKSQLSRFVTRFFVTTIITLTKRRKRCEIASRGRGLSFAVKLSTMQYNYINIIRIGTNLLRNFKQFSFFIEFLQSVCIFFILYVIIKYFLTLDYFIFFSHNVNTFNFHCVIIFCFK